MPRVLCVWFPRWPIQRLLSERPELERSAIVLFSGQKQRPAITVCTARAERAGLHAGQPLAEAKALLPRARFLPADDSADRAGLCQLALECQVFTPLVGLEEGERPECLLGDVTGCTHLWGGEEGFVRAVRNYWRTRGYHVQLALTGSVGASWALAHTAVISLVPAGGEEQALAGLPVEALRLPRDPLERLMELGLTTIGDVLRLPRETLASRFGVVLPQRLDQMLGLLPETLVCERLKEPLEVFREFEEPIADGFAVDHVSRQLIRELLSLTERQGMGLHELEGRSRRKAVRSSSRSSWSSRRATTGISHSSSSSRCSGRAGREASSRSDGGRCGWLGSGNLSRHWFDDEPASKTARAFPTLVERLSSRLGANAVLRIVVARDAQPEHVVRLVPWTSDPASNNDDFSFEQEQSRGRPIRLLEKPVPIEVSSIGADGPPLRMAWNRQDFAVVRAWGPERIATGWWRAQDVERDYYRAEWEDGTHAWIYRDLRFGCWYLHGFFD